jgi:hypothetical protein
MNIVLVNADPFGNNFRVVDRNAGDVAIFQDYIEAHGERTITCRENDAEYGNITTYQDNNPGVGHSFLKEGDRVTV